MSDSRTIARDTWIAETQRVQNEAITRGQRSRPPTPREDLIAAWEVHVPNVADYFDFYRPPLIHQLRDFYKYRGAPYFALFWEQRCAKTKTALDVFRYRCERGEVNCLIVIAHPNGVHRVWIDELPKDFPPEFLARTKYITWMSGKTTKGTRREEALAIRDHKGSIVVTLNCEALNTVSGFKYIQWLMATRKVMMVADESSWAARYSGRTKKLLTLGGTLQRRMRPPPNLIVKAILDGTPVEEGAGDIFYPTKFLKFDALGFTSAMAFRNRYYEYETEADPETGAVQQVVGHGRGGTTFPVLKGYQNLDELNDKILTLGSRVRRRDVSDAPDKTYQTRYFELTDKQRRVYNDLREEYVADLTSRKVVAADVLLRMTRLQMVARNYYPPERLGIPCALCAGTGYSEEGEECTACEGLGAFVHITKLERIDTHSPALKALTDEIGSTREPFVVWCRFRQDVVDVVEACRATAYDIFRYDGTIPENEREANYQAFKAGGRLGIVGTIGSGLQRGKDLSRARLMIYYSNEWGLRARRQSEDRAEGLAREVSTSIVDLAALDTRDIDAIEALRAKRSIAEIIMGDPPSKWI